MRLESLYRVRFTYPESWMVSLEGGWEQHLFMAEGRCEGTVSGRFRGANFPRREGAAGPFRPDFRAVIETDDGSTIMFECHGYGRALPARASPDRRGRLPLQRRRAVPAAQRLRLRLRRRGPHAGRPRTT